MTRNGAKKIGFCSDTDEDEWNVKTPRRKEKIILSMVISSRLRAFASLSSLFLIGVHRRFHVSLLFIFTVGHANIMTNCNGIIFDFDGTLADTLPDLTTSLNAGLAAYGIEVQPISAVRRWIGEGLPLLCRRAAGERDDIPIDDLVARVTTHYRDHRLDTTAPFDGVSELLDALTARQKPMAILTNKPHEHTGPMVESLFGAWSFVAIEGYRQEERRKPDPRSTLEIVAAMNAAPGEVFFVGDSATDIKTATNAEVVPVGVTWGYRDHDELVDAGAAILIDHPRQLLEHV